MEGQAEFKINDLRGTFDGYVNQKIIEDIDKGNRIPNNNQTVHITMKNFEVLKTNDKDGRNLLIGILELFALE